MSNLFLQLVELVYNYQTLAHLNELLVGYISQDYRQQLHKKYLQYTILKQVYNRVGTKKPHSSDIDSNIVVKLTQIAPLSSRANSAKDILNSFLLKIGKFTSSELYNNLFTIILITGNRPLCQEITD